MQYPALAALWQQQKLNPYCRWLILSAQGDAAGRRNLMAPQPSKSSADLDIQAPYTTNEFMGKVRENAGTPNNFQAIGASMIGKAPGNQVGLIGSGCFTVRCATCCSPPAAMLLPSRLAPLVPCCMADVQA
jgi:hypothetical protein